MDYSEEVITPLEFFEREAKQEKEKERRSKRTRRPHRNAVAREKKGQAVFITGTGTGVGKTIVTAALGLLLKEKGRDIGVMKPIQCAGGDAKFLKQTLEIPEGLKEINPYFAKEALSPHLAFRRARIVFHSNKVVKSFQDIRAKHDLTLVEGAGGILVPVTKNYLMADLIKDLRLGVIIVAELGLGTINHTLMTIGQCRARGIEVKGVIFNETKKSTRTPAEKDNPGAIGSISGVPVLGVLSFIKNTSGPSLLEAAKKDLNLNKITQALGQRRNGYLKEWDKRYLWHPFTQMKDWEDEEPLVIERAEGTKLIDTEGREYIDGVSSLWVNVHGHNHRMINAAVQKQLGTLQHSTLLGMTNPPAIELAKRLVDVAPRGLAKVFYSDSGSTAVEVALKMSYQYWQNVGESKRTRIVHMANSYHGDTLGSVSVGGIDLFHKVYGNLIFKAVKFDFPDCYRAPKGKKYPDYAFESVDRLEELFQKHKGTIASMIVEPIVQGAAGMIVWPDGVYKRIAELCRKYEVLLIADEVATGFGRTGKMFASEHEKVSPDFLCLAKGITGGYLPLAATLTTTKVYDGFKAEYAQQKTFFHGHTYTGNPLSCAAALANLEVFDQEGVLRKLQPKIKYLSNRLKMFYNCAHVGDVRQKGFMVGIELVQEKDSQKPYAWEEKIGIKVCQEARKRGVVLRPLGNVIVLMPPLAINREDLDRLLEVAHWAIEKVTQK